MSGCGRVLRAVGTRILAVVPESLTALAFLAGWFCVTKAIVELLHRPALWWLSIGLLLLSLCGWGFVGTIVRHGLYVLSRKRGES